VAIRFCDDRGVHGFSWIVDEPMARTSHALTSNGRLWLVDPVDWPDAIDRAVALGEPAAVLQLLDRHNRDCADVAERLGVQHLVAPKAVPDSPFEVVDVVRRKRWQEVALWWPAVGTLVVAEALGTIPFFTVAGDPVGVHGLLKPFPPRVLLGFEPEHLLVGHGEGLHGPGTTLAVAAAVGRSRLRIVPWLVKLPFALRGSQMPAGPADPGHGRSI
jgi:hypothetical protein